MNRTLALLFLLALPTSVAAEPPTRVSRPLAPAGTAAITLVGAAPRWEGVFPVDEPSLRRSAPMLEVDVRASELLDLRQSTLTVEVDGSPRRSVALATLGGTLRVRLSDLAGGFHRIALRARLVVPGDPCLRRHDRDAWLRVDGELRWRRSPGTRETATLEAVLTQLAGAAFRVQLPDDTALATALPAYLEAVALMTHLGAAPAGTDGAEESKRVTLHLGVAPLEEHVGRLELATARTARLGERLGDARREPRGAASSWPAPAMRVALTLPFRYPKGRTTTLTRWAR